MSLTKTAYVISAQPIDDAGRIGFEDRDALETSGVTVGAAMQGMAKMIVRFPDVDCWDLTLTRVVDNG